MRFVETNVFLYVINAHPEFGINARRILERIQDGEEAATSSLVVAEVAAWLEHSKRNREVNLFLEMVDSYPTLSKWETTFEDELRAREFERLLPRLEFFDRVYIAQMKRLKLKEIYSNDRGFDRVPGIKRIFE